MSNRGQRPRTLHVHSSICLEDSTAEDLLPKAKDTVCGSDGAYFVQPKAAILFSLGLGCHAKQDRVSLAWGCCQDRKS